MLIKKDLARVEKKEYRATRCKMFAGYLTNQLKYCFNKSNKDIVHLISAFQITILTSAVLYGHTPEC